MKRISAAVISAGALSVATMLAAPTVAGAHTATYGTSVTASAISTGNIPDLCIGYTFPPTFWVCRQRVEHALEGKVSSALRHCVTGRSVQVYRTDWRGRTSFVGLTVSWPKASGGSSGYRLTVQAGGWDGPSGQYQARVPRTRVGSLNHAHYCAAARSAWVSFGG